MGWNKIPAVRAHPNGGNRVGGKQRMLQRKFLLLSLFLLLLKAKNDEYAKIVGKLTVENNWMSGKLKSLDSKKRQDIVEFKDRKSVV